MLPRLTFSIIKVRIKGKVEQSWRRNRAFHYTSVYGRPLKKEPPGRPRLRPPTIIWHHGEACRVWPTCAKCREKDPNYMKEGCLKEIWGATCWQDHLAYARSCDVYKKEKEILEVKHWRNLSFLEAKKIVGENSFTSVSRRSDTINQENKYRTLVENLIRFEPSDWPKFQKH